MALAKNIEDTKELAKWKKVEDSGVDIHLKRFIGKQEVVSKDELSKIWNKTPKTIQRNIKDGMPIHKASAPRFQIFALEEVEKWRDGNIDKVKSMKTQGYVDASRVNMDDIDGIEDISEKTDMERKLKADADEAELKVKLKQIQLDEAEERVVDANDLDRAMSELAIVHKTDKIHDENILPILLENRGAGEIKKLLQEHNVERLNMLSGIINKEFKSEETMYDIVEVILKKLKSGTEPESIIKRINGSII